jgi:putative ABC transport system permease protein
MGAGTADIVRILLWQFAQPILWSTAIAWIAGGWLMNRWLHGFAYHVALDPRVLLLAAVLGLAIALSTVGGHCYKVARAKPVGALRYE